MDPLNCYGQGGFNKTQRSSPKGIVSYSQVSQLAGISNARHVDGYVKQYGAGLFIYPVGDKGFYRPFAADAAGCVGAYFQENPGLATTPSGGPFPTINKGAGVNKVSTTEYWDIDGEQSTRLTLTWNAASNTADLTGNSLSSLFIAGWNSSTLKWEKIQSTVDAAAVLGGASTIAAGSITTSAAIVPNAYSVYSLGGTSSVLPVSYQGNFESASCTEIRGWIWDKNHSESAVIIELVEGGVVRETVTANTMRQDLKTKGYGTGYYGFSFAVPEILKNGLARSLVVRVKNGNFTLAGSPKTINCPSTLPVLPALYAGNFESADCNFVKGWVWNKNYPATAVIVELVEGTTVHATVTANTYRSDLFNAGIGTGKYGFLIPVPATLKNGEPRQLKMRIKGGGALNNSPKTITCNSSARLSLLDEDVLSQELDVSWSVVVSPNPTAGKVTVVYNAGGAESASLLVLNVSGKILSQEILSGRGESNRHEIDLSRYSSGVYLIQLRTATRSDVRRIVLAK